MPFAAATAQKIGKYLGYPVTDTSASVIASALAAIEAMTDTTYSAAAITTIEAYLTELDTLATAINTQRSTEGSTLLPELRREYRRQVALVSQAVGLESYIDTAGASLT
jgi:hypothetical protein